MVKRTSCCASTAVFQVRVLVGLLAPIFLTQARRTMWTSSTDRKDAFLTAWARQLFTRIGHYFWPAFEQWEFIVMRTPRPANELFKWEIIARAHEAYLAEQPVCFHRRVAEELARISVGWPPANNAEAIGRMRCIYEAIQNPMMEDVYGELERIERDLRGQCGYEP